jgi:hypothetical protein
VQKQFGIQWLIVLKIHSFLVHIVEIAKDEGFHSNIGARKLETLVGDAETQSRVESLVANMRKVFMNYCL